MSVRSQQIEPGLLKGLWERHQCGRIALSWALAGGVLAGGFLLLSVSVSGSASSSSIPGATGVLFVLGALAGLVHGGVLGYLARDRTCGRLETLKSLGLSAFLLVLFSPPGWFVALHLGLTLPFWSRGIFARGGVIVSWVVGIGLCVWAFWEGWRALKRAFARWPERRPGILILTGILAILMTRFGLEQPALWGTDIQVKGLGAIILAVGATVWIALPVVLALLHGAHRLLGDRLFADPDTDLNSSVPGA